jgi:hypothetical protein
MKVIVWLSITFIASIALGVCWWFAAGLMTGANRGLEGLLFLAMIVTFIAFGASGLLLLIIGPLALRDHVRGKGSRPEA